MGLSGGGRPGTILASASLITNCRWLTSYPSGGVPPIHIPLALLAAILSRMRSPVIAYALRKLVSNNTNSAMAVNDSGSS